MTAHRILLHLSPAEEELLQKIAEARGREADALGWLRQTPEQMLTYAAGALFTDWLVEEHRTLVRLGYIDPDWMPGEDKRIRTAGVHGGCLLL